MTTLRIILIVALATALHITTVSAEENPYTSRVESAEKALKVLETLRLEQVKWINHYASGSKQYNAAKREKRELDRKIKESGNNVTKMKFYERAHDRKVKAKAVAAAKAQEKQINKQINQMSQNKTVNSGELEQRVEKLETTVKYLIREIKILKRSGT